MSLAVRAGRMNPSGAVNTHLSPELATVDGLRIVRAEMQLGSGVASDSLMVAAGTVAETTASTATAGAAERVVGAPFPPGPDDPTRTAAPISTADAAVYQHDGGRNERRPAPLQPRDRARYEIVGEHGRGGLGRVLRAHDLELSRDVAIKELLRRGYAHELRFFQEALITARLEHPGIVPVHEAGVWEDGTPFYAMKLVSGRPLSELIEAAHGPEVRLALLPHIIAVANAIAYAHDRKIIHRDLKPSNVIVGEFGETVVIDWGLAKLITTRDEIHGQGPYRTSSNDGLTVAGAILGTPAYMAPEQARGDAVDERADVYAIGVILFQLCTGCVPTLADGRDAHARALEQARIDPDLTTIVLKSLSAEPALRYPNAGALAADLKAFEAGARIASRRYSLPSLLSHWIRRHRRLSLGIALTAAVVTLAGALSIREIMRQRDHADHARAESEHARVAALAERDRARISEATLLLDKDPTRVQQLLREDSNRTAQQALLLARAAAGSAKTVIEMPSRVECLVRHPAGDAIGVVTTDGDLWTVDPISAMREKVDSTVAGQVTIGNARWWYPRGEDGPTRRVVSSGGDPALRADDVLELPTSFLYWTAVGVFALEPNGELLRLAPDAPPARVLGEVTAATSTDDSILACTRSGSLVRLAGDRHSELGGCAPAVLSQAIAASGSDHAVASDASTLVVVRDGTSIRAPFRADGTYGLSMSADLVAAFDAQERTWVLSRDDMELTAGPFHPSRPVTVTVSGTIAAWGYADGVLQVLDVASSTTWTFRGHSTLVDAILVDPQRRRVVSASGSQVRVWQLDPPPAQRIAALPCQPFNVAASPEIPGLVAFDCEDGGVRLWNRLAGTVVALHRHDDLAYGVAWTGDSVCSSAWDGRVLCSRWDGSGTHTVFDARERVRWISRGSTEDAIVFATSDGTVWGNAGAVRPLFRHDDSAYRFATSSDGRLLASGAVDGGLVLYDFTNGSVITDRNAHAGGVYSVAWRDHELWTAGGDGKIRRWGHTLRPLETIANVAVARNLLLTPRGWIATIGDNMLLISRDGTKERHVLDAGARIERASLSPDGRYVAVGALTEVIVVDLEASTIASVEVGTDAVLCAQFVDTETVVACASGSIESISVSSLSFVSFGPESSTRSE